MALREEKVFHRAKNVEMRALGWVLIHDDCVHRRRHWDTHTLGKHQVGMQPESKVMLRQSKTPKDSGKAPEGRESSAGSLAFSEEPAQRHLDLRILNPRAGQMKRLCYFSHLVCDTLS